MKKAIIGMLTILFSVAAMAAGWSSSRTVRGLVTKDSDLVGMAELKLGKADKNGMTKISGSLTVSGKTYQISSKKVTAAETVETTVTVKKIGSMDLVVNEDGTFEGTAGDYAIESLDPDEESWEVEDELTFTVDGLPDEVKGWSVLSEFSPESVSVTVGKKLKLVTPKTGSIKWDKEMESLWCPVKIDGEKVDSENPGALKLSYSAKSGKLSGSFKIYTETKSEKKAKAYSFKVTGFVVGRVGMGTAYNKDCGTVSFSLQ